MCIRDSFGIYLLHWKRFVTINNVQFIIAKNQSFKCECFLFYSFPKCAASAKFSLWKRINLCALWETAKQPKSRTPFCFFSDTGPIQYVRWCQLISSADRLSHPTHCLTDWRPSILLSVSLVAVGHMGKSSTFWGRMFCCYTRGCFSFLSFTQMASSAFLPPSPHLKESSSSTVGVRARLRQHKPANSLPQIPPIPLHSRLIPGLIIPRLWQSSAAQQTSAESALNGLRASSLCVEQTDRIHHGPLGRPLCMP